MDIQIATLCDFAVDYNGKMVISGTFDALAAKALPVVHPQCALAMRICMTPEDSGQHSAAKQHEDHLRQEHDGDAPARSADLYQGLDLPLPQSDREREDERGRRDGRHRDQTQRRDYVAPHREHYAQQFVDHPDGAQYLQRIVRRGIATHQESATAGVRRNGQYGRDRIRGHVSVEVEAGSVLRADLVVFLHRSLGNDALAIR